MAPVPMTVITAIAMSLLAFSISMVSMALTLSELITKPLDGANCFDGLPCALTFSCLSSDCVGSPGPAGIRGPQGIQGIPGVCSCNATSSITNSMIVANANITRSKIAPGAPNHVVINDASGFLSSERFLNVTRGGTGGDSSVSNGTAHINMGVWSYSQIVNADVANLAGIERFKLAAGLINQVLINDGFGFVSSEPRLSPFRGGTGLDTTGSTGIARVTSGTWFIGPITFSDLSAGVPNSVIVSNQFGFLTNQTFLSTVLGGTGLDSSASTGIPHVNSGTWSFSQITNADINSTAAISRSKIACTLPYQILVNDQFGCISEQPTLNATLGGTGLNTASSTGIPHVFAGTWSVSQIVDADVASTAAINRGKIAATLANQVVINDNIGFLTTEPQLSPLRGGTGRDSSASNGFAFVSGGLWSFVPGAINSSGGVISASEVRTPLVSYSGGDMNIITTQANASTCIIANGTGGAETICFVIGGMRVGTFSISGGTGFLTLNSKIVATDGFFQTVHGILGSPNIDGANMLGEILMNGNEIRDGFIVDDTPFLSNSGLFGTLSIKAPTGASTSATITAAGITSNSTFTIPDCGSGNFILDSCSSLNLTVHTLRANRIIPFTQPTISMGPLTMEGDIDTASFCVDTTCVRSNTTLSLSADQDLGSVRITADGTTGNEFVEISVNGASLTRWKLDPDIFAYALVMESGAFIRADHIVATTVFGVINMGSMDLGGLGQITGALLNSPTVFFYDGSSLLSVVQTGTAPAQIGATYSSHEDSTPVANGVITTIFKGTFTTNFGGAVFDYTATAGDGTNFQSATGTISYSFATNLLSVTTSIAEQGTPTKAVMTGAIFVAWSATNANPSLIRVNVTSTGLTSPTLGVIFTLHGHAASGTFTPP